MLVEVVYDGGGKGETVCAYCVCRGAHHQSASYRVIVVTPAAVASSSSSSPQYNISNIALSIFSTALSVCTFFRYYFAIDCVVCNCYSSVGFEFHLCRTCCFRFMVYYSEAFSSVRSKAPPLLFILCRFMATANNIMVLYNTVHE